MAAGKINLQASDGYVLGLSAPDGMGVDKNIVPANEAGDATKTFKVADAINSDEAVSKGQYNLKLDATATAVDATKWNGSTQSTSTSAASGGVDGDIWFQY